MKIEKGKLYYDTKTQRIFKAGATTELTERVVTDKIAVHCPNKEDIAYIESHLELNDNVLKWAEIYDHNICISLDDNDWFLKGCAKQTMQRYHTITIDQFKQFYPPDVEQDPYVWGDKIVTSNKDEVFNPQPHYDNSKGSLYKVATGRGWNAYLFDLVKRLERGGKKDPLRQEIEKSIDVLKIWLNEID